ncbi:MAG TPA: hypothetical protein VEU72_01485 [Nitrosopumilaceae archaeon]|nr:hypothetical protein [Nitrosopumilaceae archaeon]
MAKTNYMALFAIAMFALVPGLNFSGIAFADDQEGQYSHTHVTATWDPGFVCGDHKCAPGEIPQPPKAVEPVRAH